MLTLSIFFLIFDVETVLNVDCR